MSSLAFMKVLESSPNRYDHGIRILSRGRISEVYLKIAEMVAASGKRAQ
jgi:demethylmenaquinone methyltransferase/2-methoxy-6-polyprenyl-1,4-benzoquinol methylase